MARQQNKRLRLATLTADQQILTGILSLPEYTPANAEQSIEALNELNRTLDSAREAHARISTAHAASRRAVVDAEWRLHNALLGSKNQVRAQYGDDGDVLPAVGLKRASDRRTPKRRGKAFDASGS